MSPMPVDKLDDDKAEIECNANRKSATESSSTMTMSTAHWFLLLCLMRVNRFTTVRMFLNVMVCLAGSIRRIDMDGHAGQKL